MKKSALSIVVSSVVSSMIGVSMFSSALAEPLDVDWLYLSSNGSWVARSETLASEQTQVQLPVQDLRADQFWWQSTNGNTQLVWQQPNFAELPKEGSAVKVAGEDGMWLIKEVTHSHLVLQQGRQLRYWPQAQWHLLEWTASGTQYGFELTVLQAEQTRSELQYAWQDGRLTAQVRYRLSLNDDQPALYQELIVSNLTDSDISSPGYSFSQATQQPMIAMQARASFEMASDMVAVPEESQSQGVPTLVADQPVTLQAGSHVWLPVSMTELSVLERQYELQWNTGYEGLQQAQSTVYIESKNPLPTIQGPVKLGVFDQQVALLESQYRPSDSKSADIRLGQSPLVSLASRMVDVNEWQLVFSNRSDEDVALKFLAQHWDGKKQKSYPMTLKIKAKSDKEITARLTNLGQLKFSQ